MLQPRGGDICQDVPPRGTSPAALLSPEGE